MCAAVGCTLDPTMGVYLLGLFPCPPKRKAANRFLDLALVLAWRRIALAWKFVPGPAVEALKPDVSRWAGAEDRVLTREEALGLRQHSLAHLWKDILEAWENPDRDRSDRGGSKERTQTSGKDDQREDA